MRSLVILIPSKSAEMQSEIRKKASNIILLSVNDAFVDFCFVFVKLQYTPIKFRSCK